jgi:hypothetical protein
MPIALSSSKATKPRGALLITMPTCLTKAPVCVCVCCIPWVAPNYNAYMPHQASIYVYIHTFFDWAVGVTEHPRAAPVVGQRQAGAARITPVHVQGVQNMNNNIGAGWAGNQDPRRRSNDPSPTEVRLTRMPCVRMCERRRTVGV